MRKNCNITRDLLRIIQAIVAQGHFCHINLCNFAVLFNSIIRKESFENIIHTRQSEGKNLHNGQCLGRRTKCIKSCK